MRSDAKLGLALSMLVIGFTVAFCFPRQGKLSHTAQIQRQTHAAEMDDVEFVSVQSIREQQTTEEYIDSLATMNGTLRDSQNGSQLSHSDSADSLAATEVKVSSSSGLAEIFSTNDVLDQLLTDNQTETSEELEPTIARPSGNRSTVAGQYEVVDGDTLSGISLKTLGSYSRYLEIYSANRDQLSSPDALKPGMKLRIPEAMNSADLREIDRPIQTAEQPSESTTGQSPAISNRNPEMPVNSIRRERPTTHTVEYGDTLEQIAVKYFGTIRGVEQIRLANPGEALDPRRLRPGTVLKLVP